MYLEENLKLIQDSQTDILILRRQNERLCQDNNNKIKELQDIIESTEAGLEDDLRESGEKKLECKLGWCAFRVMPDKWEYIDSDIIAWCKKDGKPYYKTVEIVKKADLKKDITNGIFDYEVPGITVTPQEPKFNYKLNGGNLL